MTDREKKELIEAEETILQLFFDAYERAMKYTKGNINLSLQPSSRRQVGTGWCEIWSTAKQKKITGRR